MKRGGRPRRSEESPDSQFGDVLKEYLHRIKNFTQAELAQESGVAEKTISNMVKGHRQRGRVLRQDIQKIIKALYQKKALHSREEADRLLTSIPTEGGLDGRDPGDLEIIKLFEPAENDTQSADQSSVDVPQTPSESAPSDQDTQSADQSLIDVPQPPSESATPDQESMPSSDQVLSETSVAGAEKREGRDEERKRGRRGWFIGAGAFLLIALLLVVLFNNLPFPWRTPPPTPPPETCPVSKDGVTLYTDPYFRGHCHTFPPGDYDLSAFGLDENVSSLRDPDEAYYVRLIDRTNRPGSFDKDVPQLPADWNDQAHSLHVEKHRQTSSAPDQENGPLNFRQQQVLGGMWRQT